jgi:hypothetical protein
MCKCLWNNLSCISLGISLGVILLDHMADLCLVFLEASILLSKVVVLASLHAQQQCTRVPFFLAFSPTFVVGGVFDYSHSNRGEVESYCGFDLHFLYGQRW